MDQPIIYFIQCNDFVKIGRSNSLPPTLQSLQRGNPYLLKPIGVIPCKNKKDRTEKITLKNINVVQYQITHFQYPEFNL